MVQVRRGHARNLLIPRKRAVYATDRNRRARGIGQFSGPIRLPRTSTPPPSALTLCQSPCDAAVEPHARLPFTLRAAAAASPSPSSASAAASSQSQQRRYLKEVTAHLSRLRLTIARPTVANAAQGPLVRPVTRMEVYRELVRRHCLFVQLDGVDVGDEGVKDVGERKVGVRVRVRGEDGDMREERAEVTLDVQRLVQGDGLRKRLEGQAKEAQRKDAGGGGGAHDDGEESRGRKQQERAGASKTR